MISIFGMSISQHVRSVGIRFFGLSINVEALFYEQTFFITRPGFETFYVYRRVMQTISIAFTAPV